MFIFALVRAGVNPRFTSLYPYNSRPAGHFGLPVHRLTSPNGPRTIRVARQEAIIYRPPDMRIVPGEEEVNFERVTKVYREESGKKTLVALEADFYDKLASYIARLDESANKEAQKDPNSAKALLLQDELRKVRKRRDQIFTYRERK